MIYQLIRAGKDLARLGYLLLVAVRELTAEIIKLQKALSKPDLAAVQWTVGKPEEEK